MKTLWISIILFSAMIIIIIINALYINNVVNHLQELVSTLDPIYTPQCNISVQKISDFWDKHQKVIRLSANNIETNKITDCIVQLKASVTSQSQMDFELSKQTLLNYIERLQKQEIINLRLNKKAENNDETP